MGGGFPKSLQAMEDQAAEINKPSSPPAEDLAQKSNQNWWHNPPLLFLSNKGEVKSDEELEIYDTAAREI